MMTGVDAATALVLTGKVALLGLRRRRSRWKGNASRAVVAGKGELAHPLREPDRSASPCPWRIARRR